MTAAILPGAEAWSHIGSTSVGVLVLHGFTGNPGSMRGLAEACAAAGFHVEMPRLPGHGTSVDDMLTTGWSDWLGEADAAYTRLAERAATVVIAGLSMGGTLTLRLGANHPDVAGLVCINPATQPMAAEVITMLQGMVDSGTTIIPGIGSDIADPDQHEAAYDSVPVPSLLSFMHEGLTPLAAEYPNLTAPLLLFSSPNDHVVEPVQGDFLAAHYGGPVERVVLERSFHVATQDFDKDLIFSATVAFARRLGGL